MKFYFQKYKYPVYLIAIAAIWLVLVTIVMQLQHQVFIFGDSKSYLIAAQELFLEHKLNSQRPVVISFINGFPLLLSCSKSVLFGWSLFVNLVCWFATILLIFQISKEKVPSRIAFLLSLVFIFCIGNLFIVFHLLSETIFIFVLTLVFYLLQKYCNTKKILFLIASLFLLVLAIMIKPLSLGLFFVVVISFYSQWKSIFFSKYSALIYVAFYLLFFQMNGLKKQYGNFTVSYIDSFTYYNYLGTRAYCLQNNTDYNKGINDRVDRFSSLTDSNQKKVASEDLRLQLKTNKLNLIKAYGINLVTNATKGSASVFGCENILKTSYFNYCLYLFKVISKLQNIIFTLLGLLLASYFLIQRRGEIYDKMISFVIFYIIFVSAISSDQGDRFHIVVYPLILILFAKFISKKITSFSEPLQK